MNKSLIGEGVLSEEFLETLSWCDLITEDQLSNDLPRCPDFSAGCDDCEIREFLENINYKALIKNYGGKLSYNLKRLGWVKKPKSEIYLLAEKIIN